jgi:hypothetical protein
MKITGKRLTLNAIGIYNHSGKRDWDQGGIRRRSRRTWRKDARRVKRSTNHILDREFRDQVNEVFEDRLAA